MKKLIFYLLIFPAAIAWAGEADVVSGVLTETAAGVYRVDVTVQHADEGWDHYANKWEVVGPDESILGTRILHHPHINEQPFTRSLANVKISDDIDKVTLRAHDSIHGYGGRIMAVEVPK